MGGGHHATREDYDVDLLISKSKRIRETYNLEVYIEPGEAICGSMLLIPTAKYWTLSKTILGYFG